MLARKTTLLLVTIVLGLTLVHTCALCDESVVRGGELVVAIGADPTTIDPHMTTTDAFQNAFNASVYIPLIEATPDGFKPAVAETWEFVDDGMGLVLHLREGLTWHNGKPITPEDIKWNLDRVLDPDQGSPWRPQISPIDHVEIIDATTIKLHLQYATPTILDGLTFVMLVLQEGLENDDPIGCGPFKFEEWVPGSHILHKRFEGYFNPDLPYLDAVRMTIVGDPETRLAQLEAGSVDVAREPSPKDYSRIDDNSELKLVFSAPGANRSAYYGWTKWPGNNLLVRNAIEHCIDKVAYVNEGFYGYADLNASLYDRSNWAWNPEAVKLERKYDLQKAKALFAQAGYPRSDDPPLVILVLAGLPDFEISAVQLQSALRDIGISSEIVKRDAAAWYDMLIERPQRWDFAYTGYNYGVRDPYFMLTTDLAHEETNLGRFVFPGYRQLREAAAAVFEQEDRQVLYNLIQEVTIRENLYLILCHFSYVVGAQDYVQGLFFDNTISITRYDKAWMSQ